MKILITNHWLKKLGGSETFTYTLVKAAKEFGVDVDIFTNQPGIISEKIEEDFGVKNQINGTYDIVLANHNTTVNHCYAKQIGPIIQTIHGTIPKLEKPSGNANMFVAISQEIKTHFQPNIKKEISVILNSIDTNRFNARTEISTKLKSVLSLSHSRSLNVELRSQFLKRGIEFKSLNKYSNPTWNVEKEILESDLVISLGRGAYEAMSCGRPVLILDNRPYQEMLSDGLVTPSIIEYIARFNFSGRAFANKFAVPYILNKELPYYNYTDSSFFRQWAFDNLNYQNNFLKYMQLCEKLI